MAPSGRLELTWANEHVRLISNPERGYAWVDPADARASFEWSFAKDSDDAMATTLHDLLATETAIKQAGRTWSGLKNFAEWE